MIDDNANQRSYRDFETSDPILELYPTPPAQTSNVCTAACEMYALFHLLSLFPQNLGVLPDIHITISAWSQRQPSREQKMS